MSAASGNTAFFYRGRSDRRIWGRRMGEDIRTHSRYEAKRIFRRRTRAVEGVRCRELAQSSGMLIELIMFSAVVMVGIALLVSDPIKRVYPITTSMKVSSHLHRTISRSICERVSKTLCEATPKPLHAPKENCSIPTVAFEDVRHKLPAHNRRVRN